MTRLIREWNREPIAEPGCYAGIPIGDYHGPSITDGPSISSSGLRTIFAESPLDFWIGSSLNPSPVVQADSSAFRIGRAVHHLCLGEKEFARNFVVRPEKWDSWRTGEAKAWRADMEAAGKTVLDPKEVEAIRGMAGVLPWQAGLTDSGLLNSPLLKEADPLRGLVEHSFVWRDPETQVWLRSRPDVIPDLDGAHVDLKTTQDVRVPALQRSLSELRYDIQAALAREAVRQVWGEDLDAFFFVWVQKTPPHTVRITELYAEDMDAAAKDLRVAIRVFARCLETGHWPGPGGDQTDAVRIGLTDWARRSADDRRAFLEQSMA